MACLPSAAFAHQSAGAVLVTLLIRAGPGGCSNPWLWESGHYVWLAPVSMDYGRPVVHPLSPHERRCDAEKDEEDCGGPGEREGVRPTDDDPRPGEYSRLGARLGIDDCRRSDRQ